MAAAMCINMLSSAVAGVLIPLLFDRIGVDPALASGVALTTVTATWRASSPSSASLPC